MHYGDVILACLHLPLFAYQTLSTCHHVHVQVSSALRKLVQFIDNIGYKAADAIVK